MAWRPAKRTRLAEGVTAADHKLMTKWGLRLGLALKGTPADELAAESIDPQAFILGLVGKARPATVKKRVRDWKLFARWLAWTECRSWPTGLGDVLG